MKPTSQRTPTLFVSFALLAALSLASLLHFCDAQFQPSNNQHECFYSDGVHRAGEEWTKHGSMTGKYEFVMRCREGGGGVEVVACVVPTTGQRLAIGETATIEGQEWRCYRPTGNSFVQLDMQPTRFKYYQAPSAWSTAA